MSNCECLKTYKAFASSEATAYSNSGQAVTATASATATSTLSYEDAYQIALNNAKNIAQQNAQNDANVINQSLIEPYKAAATALGTVISNNGQIITESASATASSTLSYNDAYQIALNNAKNIAQQTAQNNANIINQSFPKVVTLENLSSSNNEYNLADNTNYFYVKGSSGNSTTKTPTFFTLGGASVNINASAIDSKGNVYVGLSYATIVNNINGYKTQNGLFTPLNYVAMWNGSTWSPLGVGLNNTVSSVAIDSNDNVYFGGSFTGLSDNSLTFNYIAKWTPSTSTWSALGTGANNGVNNDVTAIAIDSNNDVYAGGSFTFINDGVTITTNTVNTSNANLTTNITTITFASASLSNLVIGMSVVIDGYSNLTISTVTTDQKTITVSQAITITSGTKISFLNTPVNKIAKWTSSTSTWSALGNTTALANGVLANVSTETKVSSIAIDSDNNVYVSGSFNTIYNITNSTNNAITASSTTIVFKEKLSSDLFSGMKLYIVGNTTTYTISNVSTDQKTITINIGITLNADTTIYFSNKANNIAKWTPSTSSWSVLGDSTKYGANGTISTSTSASISSIAIDTNKNLYVGGTFTTVSNSTIVSTNSTNKAVTSSSTIEFDTASSSTLITGMKFYFTSTAGVTTLYNIISITSQTKINIDTSITLSQNTTISFFLNTSATNIAKWNPSTSAWSALSSASINGVSSTVNSVAIDSSNNVYVGGSFTKLGDNKTIANYIAKWDTSKWSTVGGQITSTILNGTLNGLPGSASALAINKSTNAIYASAIANGTTNFYQLFSDYINLNYNGNLIYQLYLNGQIASIYTNNQNGKKICGLLSETCLTQNYF
jgi:hypothetical protein